MLVSLLWHIHSLFNWPPFNLGLPEKEINWMYIYFVIGILDAQDNCQFVYNPNQEDSNRDNLNGDACDVDDDGDGRSMAFSNVPYFFLNLNIFKLTIEKWNWYCRRFKFVSKYFNFLSCFVLFCVCVCLVGWLVWFGLIYFFCQST